MIGMERHLNREVVVKSMYQYVDRPTDEPRLSPLYFGCMKWVPGDVEVVKLSKPINIRFINTRNRRRNLRKKAK